MYVQCVCVCTQVHAYTVYILCLFSLLTLAEAGLSGFHAGHSRLDGPPASGILPPSASLLNTWALDSQLRATRLAVCGFQVSELRSFCLPLSHLPGPLDAFLCMGSSEQWNCCLGHLKDEKASNANKKGRTVRQEIKIFTTKSFRKPAGEK